MSLLNFRYSDIIKLLKDPKRYCFYNTRSVFIDLVYRTMTCTVIWPEEFILNTVRSSGNCFE